MAEIINLCEYIKKREEKEIDRLSQKLADLISELDLEDQFEMYVESQEENDQIWGMPYIFTAPYYSPPNSDYQKVKSLSDVTDVLTGITLELDAMGYSHWADKISAVVGEMFASGSFRREV